MAQSTLKIGGTPLRKDRIDASFLTSMREAAENATARKGKKAALEAMKLWAKEKDLSPEQFEQVDDYAGEVQDKYDQLKNEWWKAFKDGDRGSDLKTLEQRMAREGGFLMSHHRLDTEYREATARSAVQALSGTLVGPPGVLAAYAAYSNGTTWTGTDDERTSTILKSVDGLSKGDSEMVTQSNTVTQVHREKLWKAMNDMLDTAIKNGKDNPQEMNLQYYELTSPEIVGKVAKAAEAGNKVRLNLDAGRLAFPSRNSEGDYYFSLDSLPDKLRTVLQLAQVPNADIGVSLFPHKKLLNSYSDLMHRKILRYGDEVLVGGMNANMGSGENIDAGFIVKGPAAKQLGENFKRDVEDSKSATLEDIWGEDQIAKFKKTNLRLGKRGFQALLDSLAGPTPAGTTLPDIDSLEQLEKLAEKAGTKLRDIVDVPKEDYESVMTQVAERRNQVPLSEKGKDLFGKLIQKTIAATTSEKNLKSLDDITPPRGHKLGSTRVDVADLPEEREALVIKAIADAEEFVYLPGFVVTRSVAAALVARRDQLKEDGKEFDVKVIADAGLYPHGSTPNALGVKMLEDHGITPRWSKLERTYWHDRKIHAKQMITDKGEIAGSTNFSNKGLRENWETSVFVHYDEDVKKAVRQKEEAKAEFTKLWDTSFELSTLDHAAFMNHDKPEEGRDWFIEDSRESSVRHILRLILNYEQETGKMMEAMVEQVPAIAEKRQALVEEGYSFGDSTIMAVKAHVGEGSYQKLMESVPAHKNLEDLQKEVLEYKTTGKVAADDSPEESEQEMMLGLLQASEITYRSNFAQPAHFA